MGTVGTPMKARGTLPPPLRQKTEGHRHDLETLTAALENPEHLNRRARRALERVTTKRSKQRGAA
jgi:hypothetical protein